MVDDRQQLEGMEESHHQIVVVDMEDNRIVGDTWDMVDKVVMELHMEVVVDTHHGEQLAVQLIVGFVVDVVADDPPLRVVVGRNHSTRAYLLVVEPDCLRRCVAAAVVVVVVVGLDFVAAYRNHSNPGLEDCMPVVVEYSKPELVDKDFVAVVVVVDSNPVPEDCMVVVVVDYRDELVLADRDRPEREDCKLVVVRQYPDTVVDYHS